MPRLARCGLLLLMAVCPARAAAQDADGADILGTWRGTSTCVDKVAFPACHDEEVIYEVRPVAQSPDSVTVRADKVVSGSREFMGDCVFGRMPNGEWSCEVQTPRFHGRWTLHVERGQMSGTLVDVPSGRRAREVFLRRQPA